MHPVLPELERYLESYVHPDPECRLAWPEEPEFPIGFECLFEPPTAPASPRDAGILGVQSLWSHPYLEQSYGPGKNVRTNSALYWGDRLSAICCLSYSAMQLCKLYPETEFVTDDDGAWLAEALELPYTRISPRLESFKQTYDPRIWVTGKLEAFQQNRPFIHLDSDAILLKPLPERISSAKLAAQCADPLFANKDKTSNHYARVLKECVTNCDFTLLGALVPKPEDWATMKAANNFGFFQCQYPFWLKEVCSRILYILARSKRASVFDQFKEPHLSILIWEQYLISLAAAEAGEPMELLFPDHDHRAMAYKYGYVHFVALAKRNAVAGKLVQSALQKAYPRQHELCLKSTLTP